MSKFLVGVVLVLAATLVPLSGAGVGADSGSYRIGRSLCGATRFCAVPRCAQGSFRSRSRPAMPLLNCYRAGNRVHDAGEFDQGTIAHQLDDPAAVLSKERVDELLAIQP